MSLQERLQELVELLNDNQVERKRLEQEKDPLVSEFKNLATEVVARDEHKRRTTTIEVPYEFWKRTEMTVAQFTETRFPGWIVAAIETDLAKFNTVIVLKTDPAYMPFSEIVELDGQHNLKVSKQVSQGNPMIDEETLKAEYPDIFEEIMRPVTEYVLDEEAYDRLLTERPEVQEIIRRHTAYTKPTVKIVPGRVKKDEE